MGEGSSPQFPGFRVQNRQRFRYSSRANSQNLTGAAVQVDQAVEDQVVRGRSASKRQCQHKNYPHTRRVVAVDAVSNGVCFVEIAQHVESQTFGGAQSRYDSAFDPAWRELVDDAGVVVGLEQIARYRRSQRRHNQHGHHHSEQCASVERYLQRVCG